MRFIEPGFCSTRTPNSAGGTDVAVTGEEFVLLSLLEVLLSIRAARRVHAIGVLTAQG